MSELCLHIFCQTCLFRALEVSPSCPNDRLPLGTHQIQPAPRIVSQMCDELVIRCPHHELGCPYTGQRQSLHHHLTEECVYTETGCCSRGCGETVRKMDLGKHLESCKYRLVDCDMCHSSIRFVDVEVCPFSFPHLASFINSSCLFFHFRPITLPVLLLPSLVHTVPRPSRAHRSPATSLSAPTNPFPVRMLGLAATGRAHAG
jgi:hypothetical protein